MGQGLLDLAGNCQDSYSINMQLRLLTSELNALTHCLAAVNPKTFQTFHSRRLDGCTGPDSSDLSEAFYVEVLVGWLLPTMLFDRIAETHSKLSVFLRDALHCRVMFCAHSARLLKLVWSFHSLLGSTKANQVHTHSCNMQCGHHLQLQACSCSQITSFRTCQKALELNALSHY